MKRIPVLGAILLIPALFLVFLTGCPGPSKTTPVTTGGPPPTGDPGPKGAKTAITAPTDGVIKGVVTFDGDPPKEVPEKAILAHKEKDICLAGGGIHVIEQTWLVGKDKGVANVVIFIEPGEGKEYKVDDKIKDWFKKNPVDMDQPYCQYVAHAAAVYADVQELRVANTSKTTHNVRIKCPKQNPDSDDQMPSNGKPVVRTFKNESKPIQLSCSIHGWMTAKVWTVPHPYFAVTKADGTFEIQNVPTGEDLVIYMWHESMGDSKSKVETKKFSKGDNELKLKIKAP